MLIDIISKNGNLLLSVPQRGDGTIDDKELKILEEIAEWIAVNSEGVYETRPWKIFGEGPVAETPNPQINEGRHQPYTADDIRFVTKGDILYVHVLAWPENGKVAVRSLSDGNPLMQKDISKVELVGTDIPVKFQRTEKALEVELPKEIVPNSISVLLRVKS